MRQKLAAPAVAGRLVLAGLVAALTAGASGAQEAPHIVQPGAPGEPSRAISAAQANDLSVLYSEADVVFMQGMIHHHAQALEMTALVGAASQNPDLHTLAERIERSQSDEIELMENWLRERDEEVPGEGGGHHHDGDGANALMPGMLDAAQMAALRAARGIDFDRLFLEGMIQHHRGALTMVDELLDHQGAAQESSVFAFTADVTADQTMEIGRMAAMLSTLSTDPRAGLAAGFLDAGEAIWNLEKVASLPKPAGFSAGDAPEGLPIPADLADRETDAEPADAAALEEEEPGEDEQKEIQRREEIAKHRERSLEDARERARLGAVLNFANSDLAFTGTTLVQGNFHGFNIYDLADPASPQLMTSVVCPGGQGDVSIVGDLLLMSVEQTRGRLDCGLQGVAEKVSSERFRGIRIFDISDLTNPVQVAAVQTCRGSHTHTVVSEPDAEGRFYVYGSGTAGVREGEELEGCSDAPLDEDTALFSIDVLEVSTREPEKAHIVARPRIFADEESGRIAGLWKGGDHGRGTQETAQTNHCHDITVFPEIGLAAGACSGNGVLLDISDPLQPRRLDAVVDEGFAYWHSATFNNDGSKVLFTDEWGGGTRPRCRASDPPHWGADAIYDIVDGELEFAGYYKLPVPQTDEENCVAHNGSLVPVPGRDLMIQSWYQGGISLFDFTDGRHPVEIAYFDRGPLDEQRMIMGGYWSSYWYGGYIYAAEIARGLDVFRLTPSELLSENEIAAAATIDDAIVNAQFQRRHVWPAVPVVARAYLDQLERSGTLTEERLAALRAALDSFEADDGQRQAAAGELREQAAWLDSRVERTEGADRKRLAALADVIESLAADA